ARATAGQRDLEHLAGPLDRQVGRLTLAAAGQPGLHLGQQQVALAAVEAARAVGGEERALVAALLRAERAARADDLDLPGGEAEALDREVDVERAEDPVREAEDRLAVVHERRPGRGEVVVLGVDARDRRV